MARKRNKPGGAGGSGSREFDPSRWAHAVFAVFAGIAAWMFGHLVEDLWGFSWARWPLYIGRPNEYWAQAIGAIIGISAMVWVWSRERYFKFIAETSTEVSQIIWPTRAETRAATIVVIVITLICACILSLMDAFWSRVTDWLYSL
jgi:preprotein translocase subunit SecE